MRGSETSWYCRRCRARLGLIRRDGALAPLGTVGSIDRRGVARVACGDCGEVREWRPAAVPMVESR